MGGWQGRGWKQGHTCLFSPWRILGTALGPPVHGGETHVRTDLVPCCGHQRRSGIGLRSPASQAPPHRWLLSPTPGPAATLSPSLSFPSSSQVGQVLPNRPRGPRTPPPHAHSRGEIETELTLNSPEPNDTRSISRPRHTAPPGHPDLVLGATLSQRQADITPEGSISVADLPGTKGQKMRPPESCGCGTGLQSPQPS